MQEHFPFKIIQRRTGLATILINLLGALVTHLYFNVIDPLPIGQKPLREIDRIGLVRLALAEEPIEPSVYRMAEQLDRYSMRTFWKALDEKCRPLAFE